MHTWHTWPWLTSEDYLSLRNSSSVITWISVWCFFECFAMIRHGLHPAGGTGVRRGERRVPPPSQERGSDNPRWLWHMLHGPNSCTHNNVHVHRHERDAATRQPANPQHSGQHHMLSHGSRAGQRELGAECDSEHAAAEPPCAFRCAQL